MITQYLTVTLFAGLYCGEPTPHDLPPSSVIFVNGWSHCFRAERRRPRRGTAGPFFSLPLSNRHSTRMLVVPCVYQRHIFCRLHSDAKHLLSYRETRD